MRVAPLGVALLHLSSHGDENHTHGQHHQSDGEQRRAQVLVRGEPGEVQASQYTARQQHAAPGGHEQYRVAVELPGRGWGGGGPEGLGVGEAEDGAFRAQSEVVSGLGVGTLPHGDGLWCHWCGGRLRLFGFSRHFFQRELELSSDTFFILKEMKELKRRGGCVEDEGDEDVDEDDDDDCKVCLMA